MASAQTRPSTVIGMGDESISTIVKSRTFLTDGHSSPDVLPSDDVCDLEFDDGSVLLERLVLRDGLVCHTGHARTASLARWKSRGSFSEHFTNSVRERDGYGHVVGRGGWYGLTRVGFSRINRGDLRPINCLFVTLNSRLRDLRWRSGI